MRTFHVVVAPLLVQLLAFGGLMLYSMGDGSFVGLGALSGIVGVSPVTTLVNWARTRLWPKASTLRLSIVSHILCLIVPALLLVLRLAERNWKL